ncbi:MAG: ABC transporter, permease protein 2 (cluster 5, nickel/peptides/opines) [uncultured Solirubrobacteraceae bacterium]|uniref:ABC transporter, permease protein 2 (Cluster 5, nickel/peptides/opines) n=1 Tax=uncultured Solirubrobacteraceae bacterium TaxID=1162706 RepID=A0A6J4RCR7_9ACTN|nr:MAG: ABC transporter, permease protein 2 (cluster 5, nickel/peptides/opines) [uncultured Solirubrobacteraceae bacterium]
MSVIGAMAGERQSGRWTLPSFARVGIGGRFGIALFLLLVVLAAAAPLIAGDPTAPVAAPFASPSASLPLGTDDIGQDVFSRILFGLRTSLLAATIVIFSGVLIGGAVGLVAGTRGGRTDAVLMRLTDVFLALPGPILAIAIVAALGPSLRNTVLAVALVWWPWYARLMRNEVRALVVRPHIDAAELAGTSTTRIMGRHLLPGTLPPIVVAASLDFQVLVLVLAGLSFLGLGSPPPAPELGAMAARGADYLVGNPLIPLAPGVAVFLIAFAANLAGDAVRDLMGRRS